VPIQFKLTIDPSGNHDEQEVDQTAEPLTFASALPRPPDARQPQLPPLQLRPLSEWGQGCSGGPPLPGGLSQPILALRKEANSQPRVPHAQNVTGIESTISQARGKGERLVPQLQLQIGEAMGADFSRVTIHTDNRADQLNRSLGARAFTTGQDVFFRQGEYQPNSQQGQELIAHELTHVVQQDTAEAIRRRFMASGWGDDFSAVMSSDDKGAKPVIQKIADNPMSINALKEIEDDYNAKPRIKYQVRAVAATLRGSKENRYSALSKYARENSHDTGIIYKDSYPHYYYLWVNCITSQTESLAAEPHNEEQELQDNHFKTVILGVGPAAAYYIMGQLASLTPNNTAMIGFEQPWDADSPLARAIAINHENQAWTLDPTASGVADSGDNRSRELTEQIQQVRSAVTWKNAEIISTKPEDGKNKVTYRVKGVGSPANADNDPVDGKCVLYADLVISALGGGQEAISGDQIALKTHGENPPKSMEDGTTPPVFTLNEYQRWLSKEQNKELILGKQVIISGANAGVDAVYTSTQAGAIVSWVVASGMAYAPAMQNTNIQWRNVNTISYGYAKLSAYDAAASDVNQRVKVNNTLNDNHKKERNKLKGDKKDQGTVDSLNMASGNKADEIINKIRLEDNDLYGHVYVIAMGQDDSEISKVAGVPSSGSKGINLACLRIVYSDGFRYAQPILSERGTIDELAVNNQVPTHDQPNLSDKWQALALRLNSKAIDMKYDIDFGDMNLSNLTAVRENGEQDLVSTISIQPVAVYKQYDENES